MSFNFTASWGADFACAYLSDGRSLVKLKFMDFCKMEINATNSNEKHSLL